ncbi:MAG: AAA family ATPase [bacterium]|nr:AAA family ATPase [bacterium]
MATSHLLTRIRIYNYKSIARCDVRPDRLSFLVGPNGAGKSNFLDALRFLTDSLNASLEHALLVRGGFRELCHRSPTPANELGLALELTLSDGRRARYALLVGTEESEGSYVVRREECVVEAAGGGEKTYYCVENGELARSSATVAPAPAADRLYLVHASGLPEFRPVYDALSRLGLYNLNPGPMRDLQPLESTTLLARDGRNLAAVFGRIAAQAPEVRQRIEEYLSKVVPDIRSVEPRSFGPKVTLEFRQAGSSAQQPRLILAANMSDGTLRALAILVALHQSINGTAPLIGIEEPEVALHPAAAGVLLDSLVEASYRTQVLVTSHSPELLDDEKIGPEAILAVVLRDGATLIGPLDDFGRSALRDRVTTVGELLRLNQLTLDPAELLPATGGLDLFAGE